MLRLLALLGLALAGAMPLSGCAGCQPHLDVRHCAPESERCRPAGDDRILDWDADLADRFPDVARLLEGLGEGHHGHAEWTAEQAAAFWDFWGVPPGEPEKQVFFHHEGGLYRVRVLSCG